MKTITALLLLASVARADELNLHSLDAEPNRVSLTTGAEHGFVAGVGYSRTMPLFDREIVIGATATLPWAGFDLSDFRLRVGALVPIAGTRSWKLAGAIAPTVRGTANTINRMTDLGIDTSLVGGYYARRWFAAAELGFDAALATHVAHTDEYRMTVHPDAVDGWYANTGGNARAGLQAGVSFSRYDVILRAGQVRDTDGDAPLVPFYTTLTVNARW